MNINDFESWLEGYLLGMGVDNSHRDNILAKLRSVEKTFPRNLEIEPINPLRKPYVSPGEYPHVTLCDTSPSKGRNLLDLLDACTNT